MVKLLEIYWVYMHYSSENPYFILINLHISYQKDFPPSKYFQTNLIKKKNHTRNQTTFSAAENMASGRRGEF